MNTTNLKYQLVAFGNYDDVTPNAENMKFFLDKFSDKALIPNQIQEINVNVTNNDLKNESISRLVLTTQDKSWNIKFNDEKIDITHANVEFKTDGFLSMEEFITEAFNILDIVGSKFSKNHKRIGFSIQIAVSDINASSVYNKFNLPIEYFSQENPIKWTNRFAFRKKLEVSGKQEIININSNVDWIKGKIGINKNAQNYEGLVVTLDINSLHENNDSRFAINDIKDFTNKSKLIQDSIKEQLFLKINQ